MHACIFVRAKELTVYKNHGCVILQQDRHDGLVVVHIGQLNCWLVVFGSLPQQDCPLHVPGGVAANPRSGNFEQGVRVRGRVTSNRLALVPYRAASALDFNTACGSVDR